MESSTHPPLPQGMEKNIVRRATLIAMEFVKQAVTFVCLLRVLHGEKNQVPRPIISQ